MEKKRRTKLNVSEKEDEKNKTRTRGGVTAQGRLTRGGTNKTHTKSTFSPPPHKTWCKEGHGKHWFVSYRTSLFVECAYLNSANELFEPKGAPDVVDGCAVRESVSSVSGQQSDNTRRAELRKVVVWVESNELRWFFVWWESLWWIFFLFYRIPHPALTCIWKYCY